jgi:hypothetical protein
MFAAVSGVIVIAEARARGAQRAGRGEQLMRGHIRPRGKRSFELKFDAGRDPTTGEPPIAGSVAPS